MNTRTVRDVMDEVRSCRVAGDLAAMAKLLDDDVTFKINGFGEPIQGKQVVLSLLKDLVDKFPFVDYRAVSTFVDGDQAAFRCALKVRHAPSGKVVDTETAEFVTVQGGKLKSYFQFIDTGLAAKLLEAEFET